MAGSSNSNSSSTTGCSLASTAADLVLFALATVAFLAFQQQSQVAAAAASDSNTNTCHDSKALKNSAFVFVKPHANTVATQDLVQKKLLEAGITIVSETDISGQVIDDKKLIDQHYYAIASKATILPAKDIPVPKDLFLQKFGEAWEDVLAQDRACNAMEACQRWKITADELDQLWQTTKQVEKFGGGFYCGLVSPPSSVTAKTPLYVFNAFFMSMRSKFVGPDKSIHCYVVEWEPSKLSWSDFRNQLLGPTNPADGPPGSIRRTILETYKELGLSQEPNKGDNGVHASASPFEGLAEKLNWLGKSIQEDTFGKALLDAGIPSTTIQEWSVDPRIQLLEPDAGKGSVFDTLEDLDAPDCLEKLVKLYQLNANII